MFGQRADDELPARSWLSVSRRREQREERRKRDPIPMDRKMLLTIIEKFDGGPVGLGTLSASIHEEKDSIEEIIEPYLIQIGFLDRTPRGRMATRRAYEHFGINPLNPHKPSLFDSQ